ncbi:hypothetical protein [Pantoea sp. Mhis]|nr:hypothetical protein [Pantoea sp. Mhis]
MLIACMLAMFMATAIEVAIVIAIPNIVTKLGEFARFEWIIAFIYLHKL